MFSDFKRIMVDRDIGCLVSKKISTPFAVLGFLAFFCVIFIITLILPFAYSFSPSYLTTFLSQSAIIVLLLSILVLASASTFIGLQFVITRLLGGKCSPADFYNKSLYLITGSSVVYFSLMAVLDFLSVVILPGWNNYSNFTTILLLVGLLTLFQIGYLVYLIALLTKHLTNLGWNKIWISAIFTLISALILIIFLAVFLSVITGPHVVY